MTTIRTGIFFTFVMNWFCFIPRIFRRFISIIFWFIDFVWRFKIPGPIYAYQFGKIRDLLTFKDRLGEKKRFSMWKISLETPSDQNSSCPGSLLKTTPLFSGYPWISRNREVAQEPRYKDFLLKHQVLEELNLKQHSKTTVFYSSTFKIWLWSTKPLNLGS